MREGGVQDPLDAFEDRVDDAVALGSLEYEQEDLEHFAFDHGSKIKGGVVRKDVIIVLMAVSEDDELGKNLQVLDEVLFLFDLLAAGQKLLVGILHFKLNNRKYRTPPS